MLAEPIARLLLGGGDDAEVALAARFLLVFAPQVVLYGIGIVLTGVLQAHRRFAGPALAPLLSSVVVAGGLPALRRPSAAAGDVEDLSTPAELVLGVGTTLGVVALSLSLLVPLRGLRLGLRPVAALPGRRRAPGAPAGPRRACSPWPASSSWRWSRSGWPTTAPDGTQVVYAAGLTLFLVPWAALAVPLATSAYPGLAERADAGRRAGLPPVRWRRSRS